MEYDDSDQLQSRTHTVAANPVYAIQLGYDNVGRIAQKIETVSGTAHTFDYSYDVDGQLAEVRKDGALVEQYGYDNNTNRTSTLATSAAYDEQDRLIQQGGVNYTFDTDGYLTTRGGDTFTYSARGELLNATVGGQAVTYQYDGMGRRIGKNDALGVTQYLYGNPGNPFQVTGSRDAAGILTTYFYNTVGNLYAFERGGQRYYVATDHLGTPKAVANATGAVVKFVEYDAWGVKISDSNPTFELPVGFAGGIADGTTSLVRFGFRDYEPGTGRWAAKDPIFHKGGLNLYQYAANDPVRFIDPNGKLFAGAVIGIGTGIVSGAAGAIAQKGSTADIVIAATLGGLAGGVVGLLDPTEGIGAIALTSGLLGAGADWLGQAITIQRKGPCANANINWGSVVGAGIGSTAGGAMGAQMTNMALKLGGSEALSSLVSAIGLGPSALGGPIGGGLYDSSGW